MSILEPTFRGSHLPAPKLWVLIAGGLGCSRGGEAGCQRLGEQAHECFGGKHFLRRTSIFMVSLSLLGEQRGLPSLL